MADKKTSEEISGSPIERGDEWRIARSGSNYKLNTDEIFTETLDYADLVAKAFASELIAGRNYIVTGCAGNSTMIVTANSASTFSNTANIVSSSLTNEGLFVATEGLGTIHLLIDQYGTISQQDDLPTQITGYRNLFQSINIVDNGIFNINDSYLKSVNLISNTGDINIVNSKLHNVNIVSLYGNSINIQNCNFSNCTIVVLNNSNFTWVTIIGITTNDSDYYFDGVILNNGTLIAGEFSTLTYDLNLSDPNVFNSTARQLNLPHNTKWVGIFTLGNYIGNKIIETISNCENIHTPIKFMHNGVDGDVITWGHQSAISSTVGNHICLTSHHGSNDHLDTVGSWTLMKWDGNIWRGIETNNWNA
jgi:hypothetical protein